jgi:hypothetical protein
MSFDVRKCSIPTVYCGKGAVPSRTGDPLVRYTRAGTPYECLQKGIGTGRYSERARTLSATSLQKIKYIGEKHEASFKKAHIATLESLLATASSMTPVGISTLLHSILKRKRGGLDVRAYNSVLVFLHKAQVSSLPGCIQV